MALESFPSIEANAARASGGQPLGGRRSVVVYEVLQREIVLGLRPPGAALLELDLARQFSCSQGTVREALLLLQEEGLVQRIPHRGTHVSDCVADDAMELIRLRHDIECRGITRVMDRYGPDLRQALLGLIDDMRGAASRDDEYRLSLHDRTFHLTLHEAADLPSVRPILQRCLVHNHRFKIINSGGRRALSDTAERHVAIIDALDAGDVAVASDALSHHITTIVDLGPRIWPETANPSATPRA